MSIATEINRINTAKNNIKTVINQDFNKLTNQTIDMYAEKLQDTYDEYNSYVPWEHSEGNEFTLKKGGNGSYLKDFKMYGNTSQDSYGGTNLIGWDNIQETTHNGITYSVQDNVFTLNGTASDNIRYIFNNHYKLKDAGDYTLKLDVISGTWTAGIVGISSRNSNDTQERYQQLAYNTKFYTKTQNYSSTEITNTVAIGFFINSGSVFNNFKFRVIFNEGSTAQNYEPYVGGTASPNPDYPQDVKVVTGTQTIKVNGKNLFDKNNANVFSGYISGSNLTINTEDTNRCLYIECKPNTTYTIQKSIISEDKFRVGTSNTVPTTSRTLEDVIIADASGFITLTTSANAHYLIVHFYNTASESTIEQALATIQIEKGNLATDWEAYKEQNFNINLHGKNLIPTDASDWEQGGISSYNGSNTSSTIRLRTKGYYPISNDTNYHISINGTKGKFQNIYFYDANMSYLGTYYSISTNISGASNLTINIPSATYNGVAYMRALLKNEIETNVIVTSDIVDIKPMIELGTTTTDFEEYYNYELCKISTYKDEIKKSTGKNLFDSSLFGTFTTNIQLIELTLKPNTTYTLSSNIPTQSSNASNANLFLLLENESPSSSSNGVKPNVTRSKTTDSTGKLQIGYRDFSNEYDNEATIYWYQLEENSSATDYEPYGKVWYKKANIGKIILNGSENYETPNNSSYSLNKATYFPNHNLPSGSTNFLSNYFTVTNNNQFIGNVYVGNSYMNFNYDGTASNINTFKTWLDMHNTIVYYVLSKPTITEITNTTLINQLNAITKLNTYEEYTAITTTGDPLNPELEIVLLSGPAYQKWLNNQTINQEEV